MVIAIFLTDEIKKDRKLRDYLRCYGISSVEITDFEKTFGKMSKGELVNFIKADKNAYELSKFGFRYKSKNEIVTFNGKSTYQGVKCTLGSAHSNFHG